MRTVLFDLSILTTDTRVRGIGRYAADLAVQLAERSNSELRVLFLERLGWDGEVVVDDDAKAAVARLQHAGRAEVGRWSWAYGLRLGFARAAQKVGADLVHLPHSGATPLLQHRAKRVVTCHDLIPLLFPKHYASWKDGYGRGRRWLDTRRFRQADHVVAISAATARDLETELAIPASKISVVHHGIDHERWPAEARSDDRERLQALGVPVPFVLYVGDGDWRKNYPVMLQAVAQVSRRGRPLPLVWAGRLSPERRELALSEARRHGADLRLLDFVPDEDLHVLYRQALANLFVSRAEGFGLPLLEAMTMGCPTVTSNCSSMVEIAGNGAVLVDPQSVGQVADAIFDLANDEKHRAQVAAAGIQRARAFTRQKQTDQTVAIYRSLLD